MRGAQTSQRNIGNEGTGIQLILFHSIEAKFAIAHLRDKLIVKNVQSRLLAGFEDDLCLQIEYAERKVFDRPNQKIFASRGWLDVSTHFKFRHQIALGESNNRRFF